MKKELYRQGDVGLERVSEIPKTAKKQRHKKRILLVQGAATGHEHSFDASQVTAFVEEGGAQFFKVTGQKLKFRLPLEKQDEKLRIKQALVIHPKLGKIAFKIVNVRIESEHAFVDGIFAALSHLDSASLKPSTDHAAIGIPAGLYRGASFIGTVRQSQYSPQEVRRVQD